MVNWRALFCRPPRRTAVPHPPNPTSALNHKPDKSDPTPIPEVSQPTNRVTLQQSTTQPGETSNKVLTTVANGLELSLRLLKEAVTGIGVPGLEAAVNGVVKVIDIVESVRANDRDLDDLSHRISSVAEAVGKSVKLHPKEGVSESLRLRMEAFLNELEFMLFKINGILSDRNLVSRTANSQAYKDAVTDINMRMDRLISQFSAEGIIYVELKVDGVDRKVDGVHKKVDNVMEAQTIQEYEALIEKIPRVHARYHDTATKPSRPCHQGTRIGLLQGINNWIEGGGSDTPYLWLCGEVGVGKTTVAHTVAKEQDALKQLGASFFFSRHDRDRQSPQRLFPSIAYQLARFDRGIWRALAEVLKPDPDIVNRSLTEQLTKLILEPLARSGMAPLRTVVVVIDGLDECSNPASVLDALAIGIESVSVHLRILVCSRPYAAIQNKFKNTPLYHLASQNHFHDINPETLSSDVAAFLTWSLGKIASRPANANLPSPWPSKDQLEELISRASGLFIIASTYEKYIDDEMEGDPAAQLNRILSRKRPEIGSSPLAELDALYDQVLDDLKRSIKSPPALIFAREIIEFVILAQGKMSLEALAGLLTVELSDARSVLCRLTAVILLPEDQTEAITPFHASFGEYIQDVTRCTVRELSVATSSAHGRIADRCIATVVSAARNGIVGVDYMYWDTMPLHLKYASANISGHVASSASDQAAGKRASAMKPGIWTWLHLMYCFLTLDSIEVNVESAGFTGLLHIEGVDAGATTSEAIGRLMIANHVFAINHASENSLQFSAPLATDITAPRSNRIQTVKFDSEDLDGEISTVLNIVRYVRYWNKHNYHDMFVKTVTVDLNSPRDVKLLLSSSTTFRGICSLSEYLKTNDDMHTISRTNLALNIAKGACYVHETSPLHGFGWPLSYYILVSVEGTPIFSPEDWEVKTPGEEHASPFSQSATDSADADCIMIYDTAAWDSEVYWNPPENINRRSAEALRAADQWDFGSVLFWILTRSKPLTCYRDLAGGQADLGYDQEDEAIPEEYWTDDSVEHQTRYERAVPLLLATIEGHEEIKAVLKSCWAFRPQDRPTMRQVVEWLTAIVDAERTV